MQRVRTVLILVSLAFLFGAARAAPEARVIVAFKADAGILQETAAPSGSADGAPPAALQRRADSLVRRAGLPLSAGRALGARQQVLRARGIDSEALAARLAADPGVAWAVPDRRRRALFVPNDPLYPVAARPLGPDAGQWYLRRPDPVLYRSAANFEAAWDDRRGDASVVVAVIDTGVWPAHPDLAGVLLPGIDTIEELATAADGDGADTDASDPGDWTTESSDCGAAASTWHGTHVATLVGARGNETTPLGMAGAAFGIRVLPVRALGKCGGYDSDIIAGMLWAAGLQTVAGHRNLNPARVLNLSLGGTGSCEAAYVDAVERLNAAGVMVVAAAGNDAGLAVGTPANCPGVIGVGGLRHAGTKVGFSDLGPEIALSAPGGNCVNISAGSPCLYPILAGTNTGLREPVAGGVAWTDSFNFSVGTSYAAPIVSGAAALVLARRPALRPDEARAVLQDSVRPFPVAGADVPVCRPPNGTEQLECQCPNDGSLCGAGMLDAAAAVLAADGGFARIEVVTATPRAGQPLTLDGSTSLPAAGQAVAAYAWTLLDGGGIVTGFDGPASDATVRLTPSGAGSLRLRLTVRDDAGGLSSAVRSVEVLAAPASSGGGAFGGVWLLALLGAVVALRRR